MASPDAPSAKRRDRTARFGQRVRLLVADLFIFDRNRLGWRLATRTLAGLLLPLLAAHYFDRPALVWMALGAFVLAIGDCLDDGDHLQPLRLAAGALLGGLALASGVLAGGSLILALGGMLLWGVDAEAERRLRQCLRFHGTAGGLGLCRAWSARFRPFPGPRRYAWRACSCSSSARAGRDPRGQQGRQRAGQRLRLLRAPTISGSTRLASRCSENRGLALAAAAVRWPGDLAGFRRQMPRNPELEQLSLLLPRSGAPSGSRARVDRRIATTCRTPRLSCWQAPFPAEAMPRQRRMVGTVLERSGLSRREAGSRHARSGRPP